MLLQGVGNLLFDFGKGFQETPVRPPATVGINEVDLYIGEHILDLRLSAPKGQDQHTVETVVGFELRQHGLGAVLGKAVQQLEISLFEDLNDNVVRNHAAFYGLLNERLHHIIRLALHNGGAYLLYQAGT